MTILEMLEQSAVLTVLGVGVVFSFLILLIICISFLGKIFHALESRKNVSSQGGTTADIAVKKEENNPHIAAIIAAINEYRKSC